jgi:two-component sensor histidine kinase
MDKETSSEFSPYYEQTRYNLVWDLSIVFCVLMAAVCLLNYSNPKYSATPNVIAIVYAIVCLFILKIKKDYRLVSILISMLSLILISATFFLLKNTIHYTTPMWMLVNILFTYFTLKSRWGAFVLIAHFIVLDVYIFTKHDLNIHTIHPFDTQDLFNYAIEFSILCFAIGYILYQFVKSNNYAERELTATNKNLSDKNLVISKQNTEMDVMLKEIHHRVKNNLQVIISLLRLQSLRQNGNNESGFSEAINRVKAMSLIHEQMYQGELLAFFDLEKYLRSFADKLVHSYALDKQVKINVRSNYASLTQKNIVPVALLFNELITNSLKHAFSNQAKPEIRIEIKKIDNDHFSITYSDNGSWVDSTVNNFGSELIEAMTEQLDGKKTLTKSENGSSYYFELTNVK